MSNNTIYAANWQHYQDHGYVPLPLRPGQKAEPPRGFTGRNAEIPGTAHYEDWAHESPMGNIALHLQSGVIGIDVDAHKGPDQSAAWDELVSKLGALPDDAPWCSSRADDVSGIRLFKVPESWEGAGVLPSGSNGVSPGEVIQNHHRYVIVPPSVFEGRAYRWVNGLLPPALLPDLPGAWLEYLSASRPCSVSSVGRNTGWTNPDLASLVSGGIPRGQNQDEILRDVMWKLRADGISQDVAFGIWRVIADKTPLERAGEPWTMADALRHWNGASSKLSKLSATEGSECFEYESPLPLGGNRDLPAFPVGSFPEWLCAQVNETARYTQTPVDLAAMTALAVLSAAGGGKVKVRGRYEVPVNLYTVAVMGPGERKSPVFSELTKPLVTAETRLAEQMASQITQLAAEQSVAQKTLERAINDAARAPSDMDKQAEVNAAAMNAEKIKVPARPRLIADDVTPEQAVTLMADQGGRLAILSAEGGIFGILAGRYSSGEPNLDWILKAWSAELIRVDRKGRSAESVNEAALTMGLCVQPEVLRKIIDAPGFRGRGLLARLLYSVPVSAMGHRSVGEPPVSQVTSDRYESKVSELAGKLAALEQPVTLSLAADAVDLHTDAERALEPRLEPYSGNLAGIADWASKLMGTVMRLAGLLHMASAEDWRNTPVARGTMADALKIGDYLLAHALAAFDTMGSDPAVEDARHLLRWITGNASSKLSEPLGDDGSESFEDVSRCFSKREIHQGVRGQVRFQKAEDLDRPLRLLEQHGHIRQIPAESTAKGGRPSERYEVNPAIWDTQGNILKTLRT